MKFEELIKKSKSLEKQAQAFDKAMDKLESDLSLKFMWDLKVIDKHRILFYPHTREIDIYSQNPIDTEFQTTKTINGNKWKIGLYLSVNNFKTRENFVKEVQDWIVNIIKTY